MGRREQEHSDMDPHHSDDTKPAKQAASPTSATSHTPVRVLVAEDDCETRATLAAALQARGYEVMEAENGMDVLAQLRLDVEAPEDMADVIVTDVRMPGLTGMEILEGLRANASNVSVIIISGFMDDETIAEARRLGVTEVLAKPFTIDTFMAAVQNAAPIP